MIRIGKVQIYTAEMFKNLKAESRIELSDAQLARMHELLLGMMDDIVACCERYGIAYNLGGGSALGAVRHKGFIPWDDDLDIDMPRDDFERFCEVFPKLYGGKYVLQVPGVTEDYCLQLGKVRLLGTTLRMHDETTDCDGVAIDIFIRENTYDNVLLRSIHGIGCMYYGLMISCRRFYALRDSYLELAKEDIQLRTMVHVKNAIGFLCSWRSLRGWSAAADRWNSRCKNADSKYVVVPSGRRHFFGEIYERSLFGDGCPMSFEGRMWMVPARWDEYLTIHYGDYMKIPKDADKEKHAYLAVDLGQDDGDSDSDSLADGGTSREGEEGGR